MGSTGPDVTTLGRAQGPFGCQSEIPPSPPTRVVWGKLSVFNALAARFYRKSPFFRNLEAKFLVKKNLCGLVCEMELGAMPQVYAENTPITDRVTH